MADLEALVKTRGYYKGKISRIINWYNANVNTEKDYMEFEVRINSLTQAFECFENTQMQIENIDPAKKDEDGVEDKYFSCLAKLKRRVLALSPTQDVQRQVTPVARSAPNVNLPQLNIPQFNGDITKWNAFYQLFETLIIDNQSLTSIQKLIYLKSYLKDEPLHLIETLQLTIDNFQIAVDTLKQRYDNQLSIIFAHIKNLVDIPTLTKVNAHTLREFIVCIKQNVDSLKNQQIPVDQWDLILIYLFSQKLDFGTKKAYISERGSKMSSTSQATLPKLEDFLNFLEKRCSVLEDLSENFSNKNLSHGYSSITQRGTSGNKFQKFSHYAQGNQQQERYHTTHRGTTLRCHCCQVPDHKIYTCPKFKNLSLKQKKEFVTQNGLCFNCLGSKHQVKDCTSQLCSLCGKKHHSLLHPIYNENSPDKRHQNVYSRNPNWRNNNPGQNNFHSDSHSQDDSSLSANHSQNPNSNRSPSNQSPQSGSSNGNSHRTLSVFASDDNEVLLSTSLVNIPDFYGTVVTARAMIDPGSTISIVTEDLLKKLKFTPERQQVKISGIGGNVEHSNKAICLQVKSILEPDFSLKVNCCVLNKITEKAPHFCINKGNLNLPKNVKLADPQFNKPATVDMLLGADVYYKILSGDMMKVNNDALTLVGTHLGYILSGLIPPRALIQDKNRHSLKSNSCFFVQSNKTNPPVDSLLEKFWSLEEVPLSQEKILSAEDELVEKNFCDTTLLLANGSFQVDLPFKTPKENYLLGDSFHSAKKRFYNLEKRF